MGGCCSSSHKVHLQRTPVYYYCQPTSDEESTFHSYNGSSSTLAAGFFVGLDLDTSIPDTYKAPPAPIPFNVLFGRPHSPLATFGNKGGKQNSAEQSVGSLHSSVSADSDFSETSASEDDMNISHGKRIADTLFSSPTQSETENSETNLQNELGSEDEDCCPICLEEYDAENLRWVTNCKHEFHLSCILEWIERSDSCPICDKEMTFDHNNKRRKVSSNASFGLVSS